MKKILSWPLISLAFSSAVSASEPLPTIDGNVFDNGSRIAVCVELTDSTPSEPKYFSGGAWLPMMSRISPAHRQPIYDGIVSAFQTVGEYSSSDVLTGDSEMVEAVSEQIKTVERMMAGTNIKFGPANNSVITGCYSQRDFAHK